MSDPILYCDKCRFHFGPVKNMAALPPKMMHLELGGMCPGRLVAHKPVYAAVFLDLNSKRKVLEARPPQHKNVYAEHVTLAFGRHLREKYPIGDEIELRTGMHYDDERGQCISILLEDGLKALFWEEQVPHLTISCAEGVKPFYSTDLMKAKTNEKIWIMSLRGVVDYYPRLTS